MYNYWNLDDNEFEDLCKDVLGRMLSKNLRMFARGRDGGIDLTDNVVKPNIIVQVKHYIRSKYSDLYSQLKKEIPKVEHWNPKEYYVCCGMELTAANIKGIYSLFSDYMKSDDNIITLKEIDEFLQKEENEDIVRKHYKLWLYASNILNEVLNQNIFIDCETLLSDIEEESRYFVQTVAYTQCLEHLSKHRIIMITGHPGIGKTFTSKMLVLYYASKGYRVRYSTNGSISDIKRSLSIEKDLKEIILLDDCLGQHYFNMKENQENELTGLTKYVQVHKNKVLVLNSRITILNEACEQYGTFNLFFKEKKIDKLTINMDTISDIEKAKIFYNHLIYKKVPEPYYNNIKKDKGYLKIVCHKNYTPRIIQYVTLESNYQSIEPNRFTEYIIDRLNNPDDIWKEEYRYRLQKQDRTLLTTLYSLTDTDIEYSILKRCYEKRLSLMKDIDYTLNSFDAVVTRLNQSVIKIIDYRGKKNIGVINPSVNDFLKGVFRDNSLEIIEIKKAFNHINQIHRCCPKEEFVERIYEMISNGTILQIDFSNFYRNNYFITSFICDRKIQDKQYKDVIYDYLQYSYGCVYKEEELLSHDEILTTLLSYPLVQFYNILDIINGELVAEMLEDLTLDEAVSTINVLREHYLNIKSDSREWFNDVCAEKLVLAINEFTEEVDISTYIDSYNMQDLINDNTTHEEYGIEVDTEKIIDTIKEWITYDIEDEILIQLGDLADYFDNLSYTNILPDKEKEISSIVESYLEPEPDYDDEYERYREDHISLGEINEIEDIFERD